MEKRLSTFVTYILSLSINFNLYLHITFVNKVSFSRKNIFKIDRK